jgi:hypothetical protein
METKIRDLINKTDIKKPINDLANKVPISKSLRDLVGSLQEDLKKDYWSKKLKDRYDTDVHTPQDLEGAGWILREIYLILDPVPTDLIKACKVKTLHISNTMGPSHKYSPNHGFYINQSVTLNADIFYHPDNPDDFVDSKGYSVSRPRETLIHEYGHAIDKEYGELSIKDAWLRLSGWSEKPGPGLERLRIKEKGAPELVGEWYHDQKAEFTRFYGGRNPWDDMADCIAFYLCGLKDKVPTSKRQYFDRLLQKFYKS